MQPLGDNCDHCQLDYTFDDGTDYLVIYPKAQQYSHIRTVCPNCQSIEHIFIGHQTIGVVIAQGILPIHADELLPPLEVVGLYDELEGKADEAQEADMPDNDSLTDYHESGTSYGLPEPPRDWLIELYDTMREFGGESKMNGQCLTKGCEICGSNGPVRIPKKTW
jgi:hypothetical protein